MVLPASVRDALRDSLAAAILAAKQEGSAERNALEERALAAEAAVASLRNQVLTSLRLEAAPPHDQDELGALEAVANACRPLVSGDATDDDGSDDAADARFLRQLAVVHAVRSGTDGSASSYAAPLASPFDVGSFLVHLLLVTLCGAAAPPKHAQAFIDAAFALLSRKRDPPSQPHKDALASACDALCAAVAADDTTTKAAAACHALKRAAAPPSSAAFSVPLSGAILLAAATKLRAATESCSSVVLAFRAAPFCVVSPDPKVRAATEEATALYEASHALYRIALAALTAVAKHAARKAAARSEALRSAAAEQQQQNSDADGGVLKQLEAFARVHATSQRLAPGLAASRFACLGAAVERLTAAANAAALSIMAPPPHANGAK